MYTCKKCNITKDLKEFHKSSRNKSGHFYQCKTCINNHNLNWYKNNKERSRLNGNNWDQTNRLKRAEYKLKARYGINKEKYEEIFKIQEEKCAICQKDGLKLFVDHCHKTNIIRGLLCNNCNIALGGFRDSINALVNAIEYLKRGNNV
jgi:hypothetical protein